MSTRTISLIVLILLGVLGLRLWYFFSRQSALINGQIVKLQVILQEEPEFSNRGQQFSVKTGENQQISIRTGQFPLYHYGDSLAIQGKLQAKMVGRDRAFYTLNYPKIVVGKEEMNPFFEASKWVREKSLRLFSDTLPPIASNLLLGIVFGAKGDFPQSFKDALQSAGVLHVIAASGMNVSFFTGAVMFSLGMILKRRIAIILSVIAAIFYSFLVGFEASILRATVMALITFTASFFGRQSLAIVTLFLTGLAMLLVQPAFLFDVGFQLSFMATLGILIIGRELGTIFWLEKLWIGEDLKTTLSAELATLPILLSTFGKVGMLGILVNVLVLWTVPIMMLLGSLAVLGGILYVPLGKFLLLLCLPFLWFFEYIISFFGSLGWNMTIDTFPWELIVGYYLVVAGIIIFVKKQTDKRKSEKDL